MGIRCTSKAVIFREGKLLLNRCRQLNGEIYYDLPGGGQHLYETMEDALTREVREETGYTVRIVRFAGIAEEIYTSALMREKYPEYTHRILHLFVAECTDVPRAVPTETDLYMDECVWLPIEQVKQMRINPEGIADHLEKMILQNEVFYLGTRMIDKTD